VNRHRLLFGLCLILLVLAVTRPPTAAADCQDWVARTVSVQGRVETRRAGESQWLPVQIGAAHCLGDAVRLGTLSRAAIVLREGGVVRLDQNTTITFTPPPERAGTWLDVLTGTAHFFTRAPRRLRVTTPFVNGSVEGTEFLVEVDVAEARISVWEGRVLAENAQGSVELRAGQSAAARAGQAPMLRPITVRPADAVTWALYYPPVLDLRPDDFPDRAGESWRQDLRRSIAAAQAGDLEAAFASLARVPDPAPDPKASLYRASLLLSVGRAEQARPAIEHALALDPGDATARALQAILAVTRNERAGAVRLADEAVARDPASVAALVAQSYAREASFDLDGARQSLEAAVRLDPGSALSRARLAELWLAQGRVDQALHEAEEAVRLAPGLGRTRAVLGFVLLARLDVTQASEAFERSIALDPAAPLPRLGFGLSRIRQGHLEAGRQDLEIAVSLDPGDSLLRSYLGKAYYEERQTVLAADQFRLAQDLDPNDPTPWLYDAIRLQSVNRPVEALESLQRSIELNDNRAVYRSRLLLDEDRATRAANLARIYDDLGFRQRALLQGWESLQVDPTNYSAHRFLADSYSALPRHEIARVSELLQSQLLQPLTITPVQPQLGLSKSFFLVGAGPANPSFNEFNPLFERNRLSVWVSGLAGNNDTFGDQVVLTGLWNRFAISVGQFHYETDGFRPNNDLKEDIYNVFAQFSPSNDTSIQVEFRSEDVKNGDLPLRFDPENFSDTLRQSNHTDSIRLGLRQVLTSTSTLLATGGYAHADVESDINPNLSLTTEEDGYWGELQYLFRGDWVGLILGGGHFQVDRTDRLTGTPDVQATIRQSDVYGYATLRPSKTLNVTLGASGDFFSGGLVDRDQFNPKIGLVWNPAPGTTLRAAAFRVLKRTLITDQTLEPTQVAGFNQFFDDPEGTTAWRYGVGVDQVISRRLFAGAEFSRRDLTTPTQDFTTDPVSVFTQDEQEDLARGYVYWAPLDWLALSLEYQYEHLKRDPAAENPEQLAESRTHRVPLTVSVFHRSGFSGSVRGTFVDQSGTFGDGADGLIHGEDTFFLVDVALSYRLPKRWGIVTLEARNIFDTRIRFQDTDPANPTISPERAVVLKFTVAY
jgi:tetratricopeptide (TPR) repeat protein